MKRTRAAWLAFAPLAFAACSLLVDPEVGSGLGAPCVDDDECQASTCIDGLCAVGCNDSSGCPGGTVCANSACSLPLGVGFVLAYDIEQDQFGESLAKGSDDLVVAQAYVVPELRDDAELASEAVARANELTATGARVIVAGSPLYGSAFQTFAESHPDVTVLSYESPATSTNLVRMGVRTYEAYYLAGLAAGRITQTGRLGMLGSIASPPTIASINAFALGAQTTHPGAIVELRWMGAPHDTSPKVDGKSKERRDTEDMVLDTGCDVIAHTLDNSIPLYTLKSLIDDGADVYGIGANLRDACDVLPAGRCIGTTYFEWGPYLSRIIHRLHHYDDVGPIEVERIRVSDTDSAFGFIVGDNIDMQQQIATEVDAVRASLATNTGAGQIFDGPITSTGQCEAALGTSPCVAEGAELSEEGLASMCWLVAGIVDETGAPAMAPASCTPL
ncbi:MAG: BMP family ABC transporter substrate-binding protein [Polyangiaceae bacterium]